MDYQKHETAIIDEGAKIGKDSRIWHWVHVCSGAQIGENCSLGQNVFVGANVKIGNQVKIQNNVSVYESVEIEDNVFCGPSMVFTNVYNPRSEIVRKSEYRKTLVKSGTTIGANATIICGITLHKYTFVGAGAVVNKDTKEFSLVAGVPAKQIGWMSKYGEQIPLPLKSENKESWTCPHSGEVYTLTNDKLSLN